MLRKCSPIDHKILREISISTYNDTFDQHNSKEDIEAYLTSVYNEEKLKSELGNEHCGIYFAINDGEIAGHLKVYDIQAQTDIRGPAFLELKRIYIKKEFLGKKPGLFFFQSAVDIASASFRWETIRKSI